MKFGTVKENISTYKFLHVTLSCVLKNQSFKFMFTADELRYYTKTFADCLKFCSNRNFVKG